MKMKLHFIMDMDNGGNVELLPNVSKFQNEKIKKVQDQCYCLKLHDS